MSGKNILPQTHGMMPVIRLWDKKYADLKYF